MKNVAKNLNRSKEDDEINNGVRVNDQLVKKEDGSHFTTGMDSGREQAKEEGKPETKEDSKKSK